jgi:geranylgeranyl diphosphate synthase type II
MNKEYLEIKNELDRRLECLLTKHCSSGNPLYHVMEHGITTPGKRIRGVMTVVFCRRLSVADELSFPFAEALELIHAYSLVHDDMPEMDNDQYRRGVLTCHAKYGADMALLAGDGILNLAVEHLLKSRKLFKPFCFLDAMEAMFNAAGANGMLCGQALDKEGESRTLTMDELLLVHKKKTGKLLMAPILIAQSLAESENDNYVNYSRSIGLAFQIKDDILDKEGTLETLGKEAGADSKTNKSTFVSLLGLEQAKEYLNREIRSAQAYADNDPFLCWLAEYIESRKN